MNIKISETATKIAKSDKPFVVVFKYHMGTHKRGEILNTHKSYEAALQEAACSEYESSLTVIHARITKVRCKYNKSY